MANDVTASEPRTRTPGVWESPDAPDGYIALVVHSNAGRRLMRIEVAEDVYDADADIVERLEQWRAEHDNPALKLV